MISVRRPVYFISPSWKGGYLLKCSEDLTTFGTGTFPEMNEEGAKKYAWFLAEFLLCEVRVMDDWLNVVHRCRPDETFHLLLLRWLSVLACLPPDAQAHCIQSAPHLLIDPLAPFRNTVEQAPPAKAAIGEGEVLVS